jgi:butyryl-CoA dehydrogenase
MKDFNGKVVVITGAGSGIGKELAIQLAKRGAILALNDWKADELDNTWNELPEKNRGYKSVFDVGDRASVEQFAKDCQEQLGRVDVVINNAGMSVRQMPVVHSEIESYEAVLRVNLWGVIYGSLAFLPHLRKNPGSSLVNVSSVFGLMGFPGSAPYNVSKFGVRGFTETLRVEMKDTPLHVACVHPGGIRTNIAKNVEIDNPKERDRFIKTFEKQAPTTAKQAAATIIRGIEKQKTRILIGKDARFIDRITRLIPSSYENILARWLKSDQFLRERD